MAKLPGTCERAGVRVERVRSVARIRARMNLCVCVCVCALRDDTYVSTRKKGEAYALQGKWQFVEEKLVLVRDDDQHFSARELLLDVFILYVYVLFGIMASYGSRWFV